MNLYNKNKKIKKNDENMYIFIRKIVRWNWVHDA